MARGAGGRPGGAAVGGRVVPRGNDRGGLTRVAECREHDSRALGHTLRHPEPGGRAGSRSGHRRPRRCCHPRREAGRSGSARRRVGLRRFVDRRCVRRIGAGLHRPFDSRSRQDPHRVCRELASSASDVRHGCRSGPVATGWSTSAVSSIPSPGWRSPRRSRMRPRHLFAQSTPALCPSDPVEKQKFLNAHAFVALSGGGLVDEQGPTERWRCPRPCAPWQGGRVGTAGQGRVRRGDRR